MLAKHVSWYSRQMSSTSHSNPQFYRFLWILVGWSCHFGWLYSFYVSICPIGELKRIKFVYFDDFINLMFLSDFQKSRMQFSCSLRFLVSVVVWKDQVHVYVRLSFLWWQRLTIELISGGHCEHFSIGWFQSCLPHSICVWFAFSQAQWTLLWVVFLWWGGSKVRRRICWCSLGFKSKSVSFSGILFFVNICFSMKHFLTYSLLTTTIHTITHLSLF